MKAFETFSYSLADASSEILRESFYQPFNISTKEDASPVTEVDQNVESILRSIIQKSYPTHGIIGEEWNNINENAEYVWVLDPIDGTRAFIASIPTFTTLIALLKDGIPILSVIDQPIIEARWCGTAEKTVFGKDQTLAKTSAQVILNESLISTTSPHFFNPSEFKKFETLRNKCADCLYGKDGYAYAILASGHIDIVCEAQLKFYDVAALIPVVQGAGGVITDWQGHAITRDQFNGTVLAAANKTLHTQALELLNSVL